MVTNCLFDTTKNNLDCYRDKETPIVFHSGSTYAYHFIIEELAKELECKFECLGENTEKYIAIYYHYIFNAN